MDGGGGRGGETSPISLVTYLTRMLLLCEFTKLAVVCCDSRLSRPLHGQHVCKQFRPCSWWGLFGHDGHCRNVQSPSRSTHSMTRSIDFRVKMDDVDIRC